MEATCIGCGCTDTCACYDERTDRACHWARVDYEIGRGVCSCCEELVGAWDAGERALRVAVEPSSGAGRAR